LNPINHFPKHLAPKLCGQAYHSLAVPTERQIQASRTSGARSDGPVTLQGKLNSSKNSTRQGLLAQTIVLDTESKDRFEQLLASYTSEFQPRTPAETTLVESMAMAHWRQLRVCHLQRAMLDVEIARNLSTGPVPPRRRRLPQPEQHL
jgi:hypothetical protein